MIKSRRLTLFFLVLTVFLCNEALAQTKDIAFHENKAAKLYSKLVSFIHADFDSVRFYSVEFEKEITTLIKANPTTLSYPFKKLTDSSFCEVKTSSDGNFRIYSWDTYTGGSMHIFKKIYQWKDKGKVFTRIPYYQEGDGGSLCSKIFTADINGKPFYLAVTNSNSSTTEAMQSIKVYSIDNNKLVDTVELFKTRTKKLNNIDVQYDFFSVIDRPERPVELITYDDKQKIIYIPVVGDKRQVTKKNILYQLKEQYFEFIGIETGKRK